MLVSTERQTEHRGQTIFTLVLQDLSWKHSSYFSRNKLLIILLLFPIKSQLKKVLVTAVIKHQLTMFEFLLTKKSI